MEEGTEHGLSASMDGRQNEKKQPLKIVSVIDTHATAFFERAVDNPELQVNCRTPKPT